MLRKIGAIAALMLTLPALANAWTITAKIGSGAGQLTSDSSIVVVSKLAAAPTVAGYFQVANTVAQQLVTVAPAANFAVSSVIVDGVNVTAQGAAGVYTVNAAADALSPIKNHSLAVYYTAVTSAVTVTQAAGGSVSVQHLDANNKPFGAISRTGFTGLNASAKVRVFGYPNSDYSVVSLGGVAKNGLQGDGYYQDVVVGSSPAVTAVFALVPMVTARLATNNLSATVGDTVALDASRTSANGAITYVYSVANELGADMSADAFISGNGTNAAAIQFTVAGTRVVKLTATTGTASSNSSVTFVVAPKAVSAAGVCATCHSNRDALLVATYLGSGHAANANGPTCSKCHTSAPHTNPAPIYSATNVGGVCLGCHTGVYSRQFGDVTHFTNATSASFHNISAAYVGYKGKGINVCAKCHFQFDAHTIGAANVTEFQKNTEILGAWADSGHGNRSAAPWIPGASHDWRNSGSTANFQATIPASDCLRCHTADGYAQFVDSKFQTITNVGAADGQRFNSPLACTACHATDNNGSSNEARRTVVITPAAAYGDGKTYTSYPAPVSAVGLGVATFYNISSVDKVTKKTVKARIAANFPDVGESNICVSCHTARLSGSALVAAATVIPADTTKQSTLSLNNSGFQNSHYMGAAGMMYMKAGFTNFTSASAKIGSSTYGLSLTSSLDMNGGVTSTHRNLGTAAIRGDSHNPALFGTALNPISGNLDSNGPCVTCHMKGYTVADTDRTGAGHSLGIDQATITQVCNNCHTSEAGHDITNIADFTTYFLDAQSEVFQNGLTLATTLLLNNYGISYNSASYPYFYDMTKDSTGKTAVTDWTRGGTLTNASALKLEGACFNINLLSREPAAFAHSRSYTRRLVYDSIDFLDDGVINNSTVASAIATLPLIYVKGTTADTATGTTESMLFLAAYNRTTLAWNSPLRP